MKTTGFLVLFCLAFFVSPAQPNRLIDHNRIGWFTYNGDHRLSQRWLLHTEYQWRRIDYVRSWQQSLARLGINYELMDRVKVGGGYTYFVTFPYGEHPVADRGVPSPEHRTYQDVQWEDTLARLNLSHRIRFEERWLAEVTESRRISGWEYQNRIRYQLAAELPLRKATGEDGAFYLTFFDELFISFGKNVGDNVFNQNRLAGGIGYRFRENAQLELVYLNQITRHAETDLPSGKPVFEINNGFRLNLIYDLDFSR